LYECITTVGRTTFSAVATPREHFGAKNPRHDMYKNMFNTRAKFHRKFRQVGGEIPISTRGGEPVCLSGWSRRDRPADVRGSVGERRRAHLACGCVAMKLMASSTDRIFSASASGMVIMNSSSSAMHTCRAPTRRDAGAGRSVSAYAGEYYRRGRAAPASAHLSPPQPPSARSGREREREREPACPPPAA
jgi:hypothetical protein